MLKHANIKLHGIRLQPSSVIAFRNFQEESEQPAVWESDQNAVSTSNGNGSRDNMASLYLPPLGLMYQGTFDKLLWSFCCSLLEEAKTCPFHFVQAIPGASKNLEYNSNLTFGESSLSNSMVIFGMD